MKKLTKRLIEKSQDAFLLSLEIYNKPTINYRIESFCFFFTNSWELLLKAKILEDEEKVNSIFYKKIRGDQRRSLSLRDAIKKIFQNENDPIRKNIEDIAELRDSATHLIIEELDALYTSLFQAGVLNYVKYLKEWFNIDIVKKTSPAMLSLIFDLKNINPQVLKKKYNKEIIDFFLQRQKEILSNSEKLKDKRYNISIEYKIALVKNPKEADIVLSSGQEGATRGILIEVAKDPSKTHPNRLMDIMNKLNEKLEELQLNQYDMQAIIFKEKIKGNPKYHFYFKATGSNTYSDEFVGFILSKIDQDSEYLTKAKNSYKNYCHKRFLERKNKNENTTKK